MGREKEREREEGERGVQRVCEKDCQRWWVHGDL